MDFDAFGKNAFLLCYRCFMLTSYRKGITIYLVIQNIIIAKGEPAALMNEKYERQMKKGVLDMLVLKLLEDEKKYGYQLIQELREKSRDVFCLKEGTLYPILYRLEDEKLVESSWYEPEAKQVPRKYYEITPKGRKELSEIYKVWQQIAEGAGQIMEK